MFSKRLYLLARRIGGHDWTTDLLVLGGLALVGLALWQVDPRLAQGIIGLVLFGVGVARLR